MSGVRTLESTNRTSSRKYNPLQVQGDYNARGPRGYRHALGGPRTKAKGRRIKTEDEWEDLSSN